MDINGPVHYKVFSKRNKVKKKQLKFLVVMIAIFSEKKNPQ